MKHLAGRLLAAGFGLLAVGASYQETVMAWSHNLARRRTSEALDRASKIVPLNAAFLRERGILTLDSNPQVAEHLLQRAVALNAYDADALIGLGLLAESGGSVEDAEEHLIRAVNVSRRFKPKWALASFYARQGRLDSFWPMASAAANVEAGDPQPIFRLAHQVLKDPERPPSL